MDAINNRLMPLGNRFMPFIIRSMPVISRLMQLINKKWNLRVDPKQSFLAIIVLESQGLPTMKCQTKCAKEFFGGLF